MQTNFYLIRLFIASFLLVACGRKESSNPPTASISDELRTETARVEAALLVCDGMPALAGVNPVTRRPDCDTGDGMLYAGLLYYASPSPELAAAIRSSFDDDGRPFRSPENRAGRDSLDAFSRDQLEGLLLYLVRSGDAELAQRFWNFVQSNDGKLCAPASDARCDLTPNTLALVGDVFQKIGLRRSPEMDTPETIQSATDKTQAVTLPEGYQLHLLALQILLKSATGHLDSEYQGAMRQVLNRQPGNLLFRYIDNLVHNGEQATYNDISSSLLTGMQQWKQPGTQAAWTVPDSQRNYSISGGFELVTLARLLDSANPPNP